MLKETLLTAFNVVRLREKKAFVDMGNSTVRLLTCTKGSGAWDVGADSVIFCDSAVIFVQLLRFVLVRAGRLLPNMLSYVYFPALLSAGIFLNIVLLRICILD